MLEDDPCAKGELSVRVRVRKRREEIKRISVCKGGWTE